MVANIRASGGGSRFIDLDSDDTNEKAKTIKKEEPSEEHKRPMTPIKTEPGDPVADGKEGAAHGASAEKPKPMPIHSIRVRSRGGPTLCKFEPGGGALLTPELRAAWSLELATPQRKRPWLEAFGEGVINAGQQLCKRGGRAAI